MNATTAIAALTCADSRMPIQLSMPSSTRPAAASGSS